MSSSLIWNNYIELGATAFQTGHLEIAETMLRQAAKDGHKLNKGYPAIPTVLENLAVVFCQQERFAKAERVFKRAISMHQNKQGNNADVCRILYKLAELYMIQGRLSLAERTTEEGLEVARSLPRRDKLMEGAQLIRLANLWNEKGKHDEAIRIYKEVMQLRNQL
jgi:Tfp pilus assembly protein PilF